MTDPYTSESRSQTDDIYSSDPIAPSGGDEVVDYTTDATYTPPVTTSSSLVTGDAGSTSTGPSSTSSTTDTAKDQGKRVASDAKEGGKQVAQVAKDEAASVAGEAKNQALGLLDQAKSQLSTQASDQKDNLTSWLSSLADELKGFTDPSSRPSDEAAPSGVATNLVQRGADYAERTASWLGDHEPADVLDEVGRFARRRPGTFLLLAGVAGVVVGRLTRGLTAAAKDDSDRPASTAGYGADYSGYGTGYATERRLVTPDIPVAAAGPETTSWAGGAGGIGDPDWVGEDISGEQVLPASTSTRSELGSYPEAGR